jgi:hypothetical protein
MQRTLSTHDRGPGFFTRWPGLLSLTLGWITAPLAALANQQLTYVVNMWACGHGRHAVMHIVPIVCLSVAMGAGFLAYRDWVMAGRGVEDEAGTVDSRSRFIALLGMAYAVFSSLVILAQWLAIVVFDPCMRN